MATATPYSSKYNVGNIRNSRVTWQNGQNSSTGQFVEFANLESGVRASVVNATAKVQPGRNYSVINEQGKSEPTIVNKGSGVANFPNLTRVNTPPRTSSGGIENDQAFRGVYGSPDSDSYKYGKYYSDVKGTMKGYVDDPKSGYSAEEKTRIQGMLDRNELDTKDPRAMEAYTWSMAKWEKGKSDFAAIKDNRDAFKKGAEAGVGQNTLKDSPSAPASENKPPPDYKPPVEKPKPNATEPSLSPAATDAWRQQNLERMKRLSENILNKKSQ
jgi:hypothetical protein